MASVSSNHVSHVGYRFLSALCSTDDAGCSVSSTLPEDSLAVDCSIDSAFVSANLIPSVSSFAIKSLTLSSIISPFHCSNQS